MSSKDAADRDPALGVDRRPSLSPRSTAAGHGAASGLDQLLRQLLAGSDEALWEDFVIRQRPVIAAVVRQIVNDPHAGEDVAQEVFLRVHRHIANYRSADHAADSKAQAWVIQVARNTARTWVSRGKRPHVGIEQADQVTEPVRDPEPDQALLSSPQTQTALKNALGALDSEQRWVLDQRFQQGRSYTDIGKLLGISKVAARKRVERVLALLRGRTGQIAAPMLVLLLVRSSLWADVAPIAGVTAVAAAGKATVATTSGFKAWLSAHVLGVGLAIAGGALALGALFSLNGHGSSPSSAQPSPTPPASASQTPSLAMLSTWTPMSAASVRRIPGILVHLTPPAGVTPDDWARLQQQRLDQLDPRLVRLRLHDSANDTPLALHIASDARRRCVVLTETPMPVADIAALLDAPGARFDALEVQHESDLRGVAAPPACADMLMTSMTALGTLAQARSMRLIAPGLADTMNVPVFAQSGAVVDLVNAHVEGVLSGPPETSLSNAVALARRAFGQRPAICTGVGWASAASASDERAVAIYTQRAVLEAARLGLDGLIFYEWASDVASGTAFLSEPGSRWMVLRNGFALLDAAGSAPVRDLFGALDGGADLRHLLWQDGDRGVVLALWRADADANAAARPVSITLATAPERIEVIDLLTGTQPVRRLDPATALRVDLGGAPILLRIIRNPGD